MAEPKRARALRRNATEAEKCLWQHLRDRRLHGHKFRRQQPIGPYVVDFLCTEKAVVVEVDGSQHVVQKERDDARTARLEAYGFRVLRFWNDQVLNETEGVLHKIDEALESLGRQSMKPTRPHLPTASRRAPPSPKGRGDH